MSLDEDLNPFIVYGFTGWKPLSVAGTYFPVSSYLTPISAVVRALDPAHPEKLTMDLAYVGADGRIYNPRGDMNFINDTTTSINWLPGSINPLPTGVTAPKTEVSMLASGARLDLFLVGLDGRVWTATDTGGANGPAYSPWQPIDGPSVPLNDTTPVRVLRDTNAGYAKLFLAMPGGDGGMYVTYYQLY